MPQKWKGLFGKIEGNSEIKPQPFFLQVNIRNSKYMQCKFIF
jgi:hypothetical protein